MNIHVYHHFDHEDAVVEKLDKILRLIEGVQRKEVEIMYTLDQIAEKVTEETTQIDGISALMSGLKKQLDEALAGTNLPPAVQAKVDGIFVAVEANRQKLVDAINANIPPVE